MNTKSLERRAKQIQEQLQGSTVDKPILSVVKNVVNKDKKDKLKMANLQNVKTIKTGFDTTNGFTEVTVGKQKDYSAPSSIQEAQSMLNGDSAKLLEVIVTGMRSIWLEELASDSSVPYLVMDGNKFTDEEFKGSLLDGAAKEQFTSTQGTMAKTMARPFGSWASKTSEEKAALKAKARNLILANPEAYGFDFGAVANPTEE